MAVNTRKGYRIGSIKDRTQTHNPSNDTWAKRNAITGQFMDVKQREPFKSVAKERDNRRS